MAGSGQQELARVGSSRPAVHPAGVCTRRPQELCPLRQFGVAGMSGPTSQWGPRGVGDPQLRGAVKTPLGVETRVSPAPGARVLGVTGWGGHFPETWLLPTT